MKDDEVLEEVVPITVVTSSAGNAKRKREPAANTKEVRHRKRVALSLTKPSYLLGVGSSEIRPENRGRLLRLLVKLLRNQNWDDACGVASVLLKSTQKERCPDLNRFKFSTAMELLKHIESDQLTDGDYSNIFDVWMARIGINFSNRKKSLCNEESNMAVRLESIVFLLLRGHVDSERQNARSLMQEHGFENHPVLTMVVGLIFYELWYSSIPEYMQLKVTDTIRSNEKCYSAHSPVESQQLTAGVELGCESVQNDGSNYIRSLSHYDTATSVRVDKEIHLDCDGGSGAKDVSMDSSHTIKREHSDTERPRGFYVLSDENEVSTDNDVGNANFVPDSYALEKLEAWMLPLQRKVWDSERLSFNDEYLFAIKCFQDSLHAKPSLAALLPLVQLLLIGGEYKAVLEELESFSSNSNTALTNRMRASLLELVDPSNVAAICTSYEETLKCDPTCSPALAKLITYHDEGAYSPESLLESIALHLEAAYPDHTIWRAFASCFLRVSQIDEDRMSACLPSNDRQTHRVSVRYNRIPKLFMQGESRKAWKLRQRWWSRRHFCSTKLSSEPTTDNLELLTYKAACAAHLYGQESDYVVKVYHLLDERVDRDLFKVLQLHIRSCFGLQAYLQ